MFNYEAIVDVPSFKKDNLRIAKNRTMSVHETFCYYLTTTIKKANMLKIFNLFYLKLFLDESNKCIY